MTKKRRSGQNEGWILVLFGIALIALGYFAANNFLTVGSTEYSPDYPFPVQDRVYEPVWGTVNCRLTGGMTADSQIFLTEDDYYFAGGWSTANVPCTELGGCKIGNIDVTCQGWGVGWEGVSYCSNPVTQIYVNGIETTEADYGDTFNIRVYCNCYSLLPVPRWIPKAPAETYITLRGYQTKLYIETYGYSRSGWLAGSDNCKLISADAATLKAMQIAGQSELDGIEQIPLGVTKNIIVGWRESPAFGGVNPCGKYYGQDVICKPYDRLTAISYVNTEGARTYWTLGQTLISYAQDNTLCCCGGECGANYQCENYHCTATPIVCAYGQCPWGDSQCQHLTGCFQEGGKYYLRTGYCENGCCQYTEQEVKCCPSVCDAMSAPGREYYCKYDEGCVLVDYLRACPPGKCCLAGGDYKEQPCVSGLECCVEPGEYVGDCRESCEETPLSCYDNCCSDKHCGTGLTFTSQICLAECRIKCFFIDNMLLLAIVGLLLFLAFILKFSAPHPAILSTTRR